MIASAGISHALEPLSWQFGSDFDGDGGFELKAVWDEEAEDKTEPTTGEWLLESDALSFYLPPLASDGPSNNYTDAGAFIAVDGLGDGNYQDFQIQVTGEIISVGHDWNRFGIVALGGGELGTVYDTLDYYSARLQRPTTGASGRQLRIAHGMGNHLGGSGLQFDLPYSLGSGGFTLTLTGRYNNEQQLFMVLNLLHEDYPDENWTAQSDLRGGDSLRDGIHFGFGGRFRSGTGSDTEVRFTSMSIEEAPPVDTPEWITGSGTWSYDDAEHSFTVTAQGELGNVGPVPVVVYLKNLPFPRLGTDSDEAITDDLLDEGLVVIELDCAGLPATSMELQRALLNYFENLSTFVLQATDGTVQPDSQFTYWLPAGYRLERDIAFWNIEQHGAHGSLERIVDTYNDYVVPNYGEDPIETPDELSGPGGRPLDYNLYLDIMYPSGDLEEAVPAIAHFATLSRRPSSFSSGERPMEPLGWLFDGHALVYVDHIYNPLARHENYGHFEPGYTLQNWNGIAAGSAAIRFLRAHADTYNLTDRVGALGHSKSSYTVVRIADPRHPEQDEHSSFSGFPSGSPDPQPWPDYSSRVDAAFASMGDGTRRTQYFTGHMAPTVIAAGRLDHFNHWQVFPDLVSVTEGEDLNHLALWMEELGHDRPFGEDLATGIDRNLLIRDFFAQHLYPHGVEDLDVLFMLPRDKRDSVPTDGVTRILTSDDELPDNMLDLSPYSPITVRFARSIDPDSLDNGKLGVWRAATGAEVPGEWTPSLQNSRFHFTPDEPLREASVYAVGASAGVRDTVGRALPQSRVQYFRTAGGETDPSEPHSWQFGTDRDGDGGFQFAAVSSDDDDATDMWSVESDSIRFNMPENSPYVDAGALIAVNELGGGNYQDFEIELSGEIMSIGHDWNRFGIVALANDELGRVGHYNDSSYYSARIQRPTTGGRTLRIANQMGNHLGGSGLELDLPYPLESGKFTLTLTGTYDDSNALLMELNLWHEDYPDEDWTVQTDRRSGPKDDVYFGFGGRFRSSEGSGTEVLFTSLSIGLAETGDETFFPADFASDTTGDGVPDWWVREHFGAPDAAHGDDLAPDGSGWTVREHYLAGTDPTDPLSVLRLSADREDNGGENGLRLRWPSVPGREYFIDSSESLMNPFDSWEAGGPISATPPWNVHVLPVDSGTGSEFFRLRVRPDSSTP